jgi:hypothetical protein
MVGIREISRKLVHSMLALSFALLVAVAAFRLGQRHPPVIIPEVPASLAPQHGDVVEYWPNGKTKSERSYRSGEVEEACYYSSNGETVFEMSSETPKQQTVKR